MIIENRGRVASLDLDTGDLCRFDANGTWLTWPMPSGPRAMLQGDDGPTLVDASCAITSVDWSGWIAATTASSVWTMNDGPTSLLQEWSLDGTPTGRELRVPANATTIVGDGEWIVVGAAGEMTAVRGDERRSLGVGFPLAAGGGRVVVVRCPALECSVAIVDIRTGRSQAIDIEAPLSWEPPVMSPDGRWLHFSTAVGRTGQQIESRLVDLETLAERPFPGGLVAFTADSRWLVSARSSVVEARSLLDDRVVDLTEMFDGPVQGLVAIDR